MQKKVCHPASCVLNVPQQQVAHKIHKIPIVGCCCHSVNMILCIDDSKCLKVESHKQLITFVWYGGAGAGFDWQIYYFPRVSVLKFGTL